MEPPISKKAAKKAAVKAEKLRRREEAAASAAASSIDGCFIDGAANYGDLPVIQSQMISDRVWNTVSSLTDEIKDHTVLFRGWIQTITAIGKKAFLKVRENGYTVQCLLSADIVSPDMVKYATKITIESFVEIEGVVIVPPNPIKGASQQVEIHVTKIYCITRAPRVLPFSVEDASRSDAEIEKSLEEYRMEFVLFVFIRIRVWNIGFWIFKHQQITRLLVLKPKF